MLKEIFIAAAVSVDIFLAASACCCSGIRIPFLSAVITALISAAVLGLSMTFSDILGSFLPEEICRSIGTAALILIGTAAIGKSVLRHIAVRKGISPEKREGSLMVRLCLDDTAADLDSSKVLSAGEAAVLALAGSLDAAATGLSCGFSDISPLTASVFTFFCGAAAVFFGSLTGRKISSLGHDLSWAGGLILIIFAFIQA